MKVAILESIVMPAGHEVEFDKMLVDELKKQGHEPCFFVPENFLFKIDYNASVEYLSGGEVVTYAGAGKIKKLWLSILRERRRIQWFNSAYEKAAKGLCEAIIIPTATYRYVRTLLKSKLKDSSVPVYFIFHGINPKERSNFIKQVEKCDNYKNIYFKVITLRNDFIDISLSRLELIPPFVFKADSSLDYFQGYNESILKLGFFGQFRKEKNLGPLLEAFEKADFQVPVKLIVQGATVRKEDSDIFEGFIKQYERNKSIIFIHKSLIGEEWTKAILGIDVLIMPYGAERYLYHWSAMLFTAIGFNKPVLSSSEINPEVLNSYNIGEFIDIENIENFSNQLEYFVNDFEKNKKIYTDELERANKDFSQAVFIQNVLKK